MSRYTQLETGEQEFLASNSGWGDWGRWVDKLEVKGLEELHHLNHYGWSQNLQKLQDQLTQALKSEGIEQDVRTVAQTLFSVVQHRGTSEVLLVTDASGNEAQQVRGSVGLV